MSAIAAIVIVLCGGLFIGSRFEGAREAHQMFNSYRSRTAKGLTDWIRSLVVTVFGIAGLILVLYLIVFQAHVR
jgi:VanZ family protein